MRQISEKTAGLYKITAKTDDEKVWFEIGAGRGCQMICIDRQDAIDLCKEVLTELTDDLP